MKITSVTVHKIEKENSRMKGIAVATLDDCFAAWSTHDNEYSDDMLLHDIRFHSVSKH